MEKLSSTDVGSLFCDRLPRDNEFSSREEYGRGIAVAVDKASAQSGIVEVMETNEPPTYEDFMTSYARRGKPLLIKGCCNDWPSTRKWGVSYLVEKFGSMEWSIRTGSPLSDYRFVEHRTTTLEEYLTGIQQNSKDKPTDMEGSWYGANNYLHPEMIADISLPPYYPRHVYRLMDTRLWIGPTGAGATLHRDLQDNFVYQVFGQKTFSISAPHFSEFMPQRWAVSPFLESAGATVRQVQDCGGEIEFVSVTLQKGDLLYLPAGWWHQTANECSANLQGADPQPIEVSCSINYFMSACFAGVGVIVPEGLAPSDWLVAPGNWPLKSGQA